MYNNVKIEAAFVSNNALKYSWVDNQTVSLFKYFARTLACPVK